MEAISYFQKRDIHRSASLQYRYATNVIECDKQHYFPLSPNFCRAHSKKMPPPFCPPEYTVSTLSTAVEPEIYRRSGRRYTDITTKKCVLTETAVSKRPILMEPNSMGSNLMVPGYNLVTPRLHSEKKYEDGLKIGEQKSGLIEDAVPPRCSSPKYIKKCWDESSASVNDEHTYQFWADDFANNIGPIADSNGIAAWARTPEWFPRFTYVCLMQPPVRKPVLKPSRTMTTRVAVQPTNESPIKKNRQPVFEPNATMVPDREPSTKVVLNPNERMINLEPNTVVQLQLKPTVATNMIDEGLLTATKPSFLQLVDSKPVATMVSSAITAPTIQPNATAVSAQPTSTTAPTDQPNATTVHVQPANINSPPKSGIILSYLQKAVTPRSSRKISPTKSQNDDFLVSTPTSKRDEEIERRLSSAFQNLNLNTPPKNSDYQKSEEKPTAFRNINFENSDGKLLCSNTERKMYFERKKSMSVRYPKIQANSDVVEENMNQVQSEPKFGNFQRRNSLPFRRGNQIKPSSEIKEDVEAINQIETKQVNFERRNSMPFRRPNQNTIVPASIIKEEIPLTSVDIEPKLVNFERRNSMPFRKPNQNSIVPSSNQNIAPSIKEGIQLTSVEIEPKSVNFERRNSTPFRRPNQIISTVSSVSTIKEGIAVTTSIANEVDINQKPSVNYPINNQKTIVSGSSNINQKPSVTVNTINERKPNIISSTSYQHPSISSSFNRKPNTEPSIAYSNQRPNVNEPSIGNQVYESTTINQNPSVIASSIHNHQKPIVNRPSINNQVPSAYTTINQKPSVIGPPINTTQKPIIQVTTSSANIKRKQYFTKEPSMASYTGSSRGQSRIFPELLAPAQSIFISGSNHQDQLIMSQLPSSYDQFCETVQYRPFIPNVVSYNRPINVNGNAGIW